MSFGFGKKSRREKKRNLFDTDAEACINLMDSGADNRELARLREKVDSLSLICRAMWSMLRDKYGLSEQELMERLRQIKEADAPACPSCGRIMNRNYNRCLYCGHEGENTSVFDKL